LRRARAGPAAAAAAAAGARARNLIHPLTINHMQILKKTQFRLKSFILWIQRYH
jgi:hypothetical protein